MKPKTIEGVWWDARTPERRWLGELRIGGWGKASLRIWRPEETNQAFPNQDSYPLIHGTASSGAEYTLINCFDSRTQGSFVAIPTRTTIHANELIAGFHSDQRDPITVTASASFSALPEWWGHSGINVTSAGPDIDVSYRNNEPSLLYEDGTFKVLICTSPVGSFGHYRIRIKHAIRLEITAQEPRPLSDFERLIASFGGLLTIACHQYCGRETLTIIPPRQPDDPIRMGTHVAVPIYRRVRSQSTGHSLVPRQAFDGREKERITMWLAESRSLHDTRVLYLAGVYGSGFVETKLLALTQAAEAFHRQFRPGLYMEPHAFASEVLEPLRKAVPQVVSSSHRQAIDSRLRFANEYSQRRRIQELFDEFEEVLQLLISAPGSLVPAIIDHRNRFTHFPVPDPDAVSQPSDPMAVIRYNWLLRLLLEACFMSRIGFSVSEIATLVSNSSTYQQMAVRLKF